MTHHAITNNKRSISRSFFDNSTIAFSSSMERFPAGADVNGDSPAGSPSKDPPFLYRARALDSLDAVKQRAYRFDGLGNYVDKAWDLSEAAACPKEFHWYHVELPRGNVKGFRNPRLAVSTQCLIDALCPPLKLQDILALSSNGPFCAHVDGALIFRINSPGPAASDFTLRLAARVTESSVITVSLGRVPRLGFSPTGQSLLSEIPKVERCSGDDDGASDKADGESGRVVIPVHVLEFLLTMNHSEEADNPVPRSVSNLLVHIVDTHVDHLQDIVTRLEMELDSVELELDRGICCNLFHLS